MHPLQTWKAEAGFCLHHIHTYEINMIIWSQNLCLLHPLLHMHLGWYQTWRDKMLYKLKYTTTKLEWKPHSDRTIIQISETCKGQEFNTKKFMNSNSYHCFFFDGFSFIIPKIKWYIIPSFITLLLLLIYNQIIEVEAFYNYQFMHISWESYKHLHNNNHVFY